MAQVFVRRRLRSVDPNLVGWAAVAGLIGYACAQIVVAVIEAVDRRAMPRVPGT
jgi:hypothetical protein